MIEPSHLQIVLTSICALEPVSLSQVQFVQPYKLINVSLANALFTHQLRRSPLRDYLRNSSGCCEGRY